MDIHFYQNSSPENYVNKSLTEITVAYGVLREATSITRPSIQISGLTDSQVASINYAYITQFNRYYYVDNVVSVHNNLWQFDLRCDVLKSFWNETKNCECIVARNEYERTKDLIDNEIYFTADSKYEVIKFPNTPFSVAGATDKRFVLIVQGAGEAASS